MSELSWAKKHWQTILHNYRRAPYFDNYKDIFESLYLECNETMLSQINYKFIKTINKILGISTKMLWSSDFTLSDGQTKRLVGICKQTSATHYLSGPAAKSYLKEKLFTQEGITVQWMNYNDYPPYPQLHGANEHGVTILDLLFNTGPHAPKYMKSFTG